MARIENHKCSIEEAFRECFYIVPDYQREYVWTDKEVHQLLEGINEQIALDPTNIALLITPSPQAIMSPGIPERFMPSPTVRNAAEK
ncbi:MAG: DUF262 domain-containing protein [Porticoccaceae bacterium]